MKTNIFGIFTLLIFTINIAQAQKKHFTPIDGVESKSIEFYKNIRTYDIFCPANIKDAMSLVFMLHGGGGNSKEAAYSTNWVNKAKKENFIVVFPNGTRPDSSKPASFRKNGQNWNDGSTRDLYAVTNNVDDVGFIRTLIDSLKKEYKIDTLSIYATGFSNGASMTFRLGVECSDIFAAIAPVSGSLWFDNPKLVNPVSLLYISGDSDPLNPINGGEIKIGRRDFGSKKPVNQVINLWVNMLNTKKVEDENFEKIREVIYQAPKAEIKWITVKGMGHHWPGGKQTLPKWLVGSPSNALNGTDTIWDFFKNHPKRY